MRPRVALAALAALAGCGDPEPTRSPIPDTPLAGTLNGKAFTAQTALASSKVAGPGEKWIDVYGTACTCTTQDPSAEPKIIATIPWEAGKAYDFGAQQNITFTYKDPSGQWENNLVLNGRLEVIRAGAAGETGRIKLEGISGSDSVKGAVDVVVCD